MLNEEKYIRARFGNENHFRMPDGYLDSFAGRMADRISDNGRVTAGSRSFRMVALRPLLYAACICVAVFGGITYFAKNVFSDGVGMGNEVMAHTGGSFYTAEDAVIDYAMMDNADIYACLTSE